MALSILYHSLTYSQLLCTVTTVHVCTEIGPDPPIQWKADDFNVTVFPMINPTHTIFALIKMIRQGPALYYTCGCMQM
jgi:hypothetical protein